MREAGGQVTDPDGVDLDDLPDDVMIVAGNGNLYSKLRETVADSLKE